MIRSALAFTNRFTASPQSLQIDNRSTEDSQLVSNHFNEFFCTIEANLANKFVSKYNSFIKHLKHRISPSIYLDTPSPTETRSAIHSLSLNKTVGYDNISAFFLISASTVITPFLHLFINFCFSHGVFPENCVTAKIVPIFKKSNREDPSNYRSISLPTCFFKIMEKLIHKRLMSFLNTHRVIQKHQYGFQSNVSTNHALIDVVSDCFDNINNNQYTGLIFLDLTKAFDKANHEILHKLEHYGIRGQANDLLRAFLK